MTDGALPVIAGLVVEGRIARGAHATVFVAKRVSTGERVAVRRQDRTRARATIDLSAVAGLDHPNLVRVLEQPADSPDCAVLSLVEGVSLRELLLSVSAADEDVPTAICAEITRQAALGLAALHSHGGRAQRFVHADVSPSNVLLGYDGQVRIADYGALTSEASAEAPGVGTFCYLAPEALAGAPPRQAWDCFALGCLAFELIAGKPPHFEALPDDVTDRALSHSTPDLHDYRDDVPPELEELLYELLAADPALRPPAAAAAARLGDIVGACRPKPRLNAYIESFFGDLARSQRAQPLLARASAPLGLRISGATIKATFDFVVEHHGMRGYELVRAHLSPESHAILQHHVDSSAWYAAPVVVELTEIAESIFGSPESGEVARALGAASANYALSERGPYRVFRERGLREGVPAFLRSTEDIYGLYYDRGSWRVEAISPGTAVCRFVNGVGFPSPITERILAYLARGLELVGAENVRVVRERDADDWLVRLDWSEPA